MKKFIKNEVCETTEEDVKLDVQIIGKDGVKDIDVRKETSAVVCLIPEEEGLGCHCYGKFSPKLIMDFMDGLQSLQEELMKTILNQTVKGLTKALEEISDKEGK